MDESSGYRWQNHAASFIRQLRPDLVVETGVSEGVSTIRFLEVMDAVDHGRLISVDPMPAYTTPHPRWTLCCSTSHRIIGKIYLDNGPFDVFIHDSDHNAECQAFEYAMAWHFVRPGGYILSDDITWGTHRAWYRWLELHGLPVQKLGHAGFAQKPNTAAAIANDQVQAAMYDAWLFAQTAARDNGETPQYSL